jgi:hypothetical protein
MLGGARVEREHAGVVRDVRAYVLIYQLPIGRGWYD